MARRDPRVPITHMLDAIGGDQVLSRVLERGFEILSEAALRRMLARL